MIFPLVHPHHLGNPSGICLRFFIFWGLRQIQIQVEPKKVYNFHLVLQIQLIQHDSTDVRFQVGGPHVGYVGQSATATLRPPWLQSFALATGPSVRVLG